MSIQILWVKNADSDPIGLVGGVWESAFLRLLDVAAVASGSHTLNNKAINLL